jgi:hypothetical protein
MARARKGERVRSHCEGARSRAHSCLTLVLLLLLWRGHVLGDRFLYVRGRWTERDLEEEGPPWYSPRVVQSVMNPLCVPKGSPSVCPSVRDRCPLWERGGAAASVARYELSRDQLELAREAGSGFLMSGTGTINTCLSAHCAWCQNWLLNIMVSVMALCSTYLLGRSRCDQVVASGPGSG